MHNLWYFYLYHLVLLSVAAVASKQFSDQKIVSGGEVPEPCYASNVTECGTSKNFLRIIVDPEDANVDIVAIHGLNPTNTKFHAELTWTHGDKLWLRDFLPNQLPHARVMLFGYNSNVAFQTSIAGVREQALNLLNRLDHKRENVFARPIIFLAHSLGGIVVKRALVEAKLDDSYGEIRKATYGIAFFGTPHQGGNFATLGDIAASVVRRILRNPDNSFMEALKKDSLFSETLVDDFRHQLESYHVLSFYETLPMGNAGLIVDKKSATLGLAGVRERQIPMEAHHGDVCRFASSDGDDYEQVSFNLVRLVKSAIKAAKDAAEVPRTHKELGSKYEPAFIVPYSPNQDFVGRQDILKTLQHELKIAGDHQKRTALWGLGGIGKSQIAIRYAYWLQKTHPDTSIFWIHGSSIDRFRQGYIEISRDRRLPGSNDPKTDHLATVKSWLSSKASGPWLLVIDNVDEDNTFFGADASISGSDAIPMDQYIPESPHGAILMTTRNKIVAQKFTRGRSLIEIQPMNEADSIELFQAHFKGKTLDNDLLVELVRELDGLPLALAQAAAFIQQMSMDIRTYLKYYRSSEHMMLSLLSQDFRAIGRDALLPNAVTTTWMMSFEHITKTAPRASEILSLSTCLDRHDIPVSFFEPNIHGLELAKALGLLEAFSLISLNSDDGTFTMHKLVHLAIRGWHKSQKRDDTQITRCIGMVSKQFPTKFTRDIQKLATCNSYLPHANSAISFSALLPFYVSSAAELASKMTECLVVRGQYDYAAELSGWAAEWYKNRQGEKDEKTMSAMNRLAVIQSYQGKYSEVESILTRLVATCEMQKTKNLKTGQYKHNLAIALNAQSKHKHAEKLLRGSVDESEKDVGKLHVQTIMRMISLTASLLPQRKSKEAEWIAREALLLSEKVLGEEHPSTLEAKSYLSMALRYQEKYEEAEMLCRQVLEMSQKLDGPEHPQTLSYLFNLASLRAKISPDNETEEMLLEVVEKQEKALGSEHPSTLLSISDLALCFARQHKYEESARYYQRACPALKRVFGPDHADPVKCAKMYSTVLEKLKSQRKG